MKCEIIGGKLIVEPGSATETWAVNQWLERISHWDRVPDRVLVAGKIEPQNDSDELDAIFGPLTPPTAE